MKLRSAGTAHMGVWDTLERAKTGPKACGGASRKVRTPDLDQEKVAENAGKGTHDPRAPGLISETENTGEHPHRRRLEEDLETLTAEEQWIAQGQQKALSHLHTLEELESPLADETERREKAEDKLPVRWIPVRERVGIPLLNFKSRTFVTFAFSCYFVRFPKHGLVLGWLPVSELPDRVDEEASTELE